VRAQSSDTARIEKLERAVELLEKQNADLKGGGRQLEKTPAPAQRSLLKGQQKTEINYDGKTYVEKTVRSRNPAPTNGNCPPPLPRWNSTAMCGFVTIIGQARPKARAQWRRRRLTAWQGQTIGWSASASVIVFAWGYAETLLDDWFFGLRLETNNNARTTKCDVWRRHSE